MSSIPIPQNERARRLPGRAALRAAAVHWRTSPSTTSSNLFRPRRSGAGVLHRRRRRGAPRGADARARHRRRARPTSRRARSWATRRCSAARGTTVTAVADGPGARAQGRLARVAQDAGRGPGPRRHGPARFGPPDGAEPAGRAAASSPSRSRATNPDPEVEGHGRPRGRRAGRSSSRGTRSASTKLLEDIAKLGRRRRARTWPKGDGRGDAPRQRGPQGHEDHAWPPQGRVLAARGRDGVTARSPSTRRSRSPRSPPPRRRHLSGSCRSPTRSPRSSTRP